MGRIKASSLPTVTGGEVEWVEEGFLNSTSGPNLSRKRAKPNAITPSG